MAIKIRQTAHGNGHELLKAVNEILMTLGNLQSGTDAEGLGMGAIVDGKPAGMVLAFRPPGSSRQDPAPKDCVADLGIAVLKLAGAARVIADSDLHEEESLKIVQEIGLLASRLACLQADVVRKRMDEIVIAENGVPMPAPRT